MSKDLFIIRGVSGAGKDTLAKSITWATFTADQYFDGLEGGYEANWKPELLHLAHQYCENEVREAMQHGLQKICVANTFTRPREFKAYEEMAEVFGYRVHHIIVENRHGSDSVHNVPQETRGKMAERLKGNIKLI